MKALINMKKNLVLSCKWMNKDPLDRKRYFNLIKHIQGCKLKCDDNFGFILSQTFDLDTDHEIMDKYFYDQVREGINVTSVDLHQRSMVKPKLPRQLTNSELHE